MQKTNSEGNAEHVPALPGRVPFPAQAKRTFITAALIAASLLPLAADAHEPYRVSEEQKAVLREQAPYSVIENIYNIEVRLDDNREILRILMYDSIAADTSLYDPRPYIARLKATDGAGSVCTRCYEREYAEQRASIGRMKMDFTFPPALLANTSSDSIHALVDFLFPPEWDTVATADGHSLHVRSSLDFRYGRRRTRHEMFGDRYDTDRQVLQCISGTYDDIFDIWKTYFFPDADKEETFENCQEATAPAFPRPYEYRVKIKWLGREHRVVLRCAGSSNMWTLDFYLRTD